MQHQKSKIDIDPIIHSDTCMETTFFVKNKNKEWKMSPNSKLREVTEAKTKTAGKGVNSLIFPPGFDAGGFRDIQAKPVDEETSSDRRFCAGSHAQQRSHPRCRTADEVTKDIFGDIKSFSFLSQGGDQVRLARERRCVRQMFPHLCTGVPDSVAFPC